MDAFDRMGTVCLVLTCLVVLPYSFLMKGNLLLAVLLSVACIPIFWMAGLNVMEFLTKPFSEKGMKGPLSWVIVLFMALIIYCLLFLGLRFMLQFLMLIK